MKNLTLKDELMLLAILRLQDDAYLVKLREYLNNNTNKKWTIGNVFVSLDKLEELDYISPYLGEPTAKRGGKAIKYYKVTDAGIEALKATRAMQDSMWDGLYDLIFSD